MTLIQSEPKLKDELDFVVDDQIVVSYDFRWVSFSELFVDYHESVLNGDSGLHTSPTLAYQRRQDRIAAKIVNSGGINPDLFGPLIVNQRHDGTYAIVDGGTRYRALQRLNVPSKVMIPCLVFHWDNDREIRNYVALNRERTGLSQVDFFIGKVKYGDQESQEIENILVQETGHGVNARKGGWQCVNAIETAYRRGNLRQTMILLRQLGWLDKPRAKTQGIVTAVSRLLFMGADEDLALKRWAQATPSSLYNAAKEHGALATSQSRGVFRLIALQLAKMYNQKLRTTKRLDETQFLSQIINDDEDDD